MGPEDLHVEAVAFLAACVEALDSIPGFAPALGGAPERAFIAPGQPAFDCCPQLTVHVGLISEGAVAPPVPKASNFRINRVAFVATIIRCIGDGKVIPTPTDQQETAKQIHADKWALWNHIWNLIRAEQLFQRCNDVIWQGLTPITPQGGCGGSVLTVTAALDGYEETIGS